MPENLKTPISRGNNIVRTVRLENRLSQVTLIRGGAITFHTEDTEVDDADDSDVVVNAGPSVTRQIAAVKTETVQFGGQSVTFQNALALLVKFYDKWSAEDNS